MEIRPVASLIAAIVISTLQENLYPVPEAVLKSPTQPTSIPSDASRLLAKLIDGQELEPEDEELLAKICDREPLDVHNASKKIRQQRRNGNAKARS